MSADTVAPVKVRLLDDKPANDSSFKSHEDVSRAISSLILHEDEGKTIGLFGSWGSGKSTAVGLIEKKLKEQEDSLEVFTFDAWLHGADPLRRSFIEKLIEFYGTETENRPKYIDKSSEEYLSLLDEITRRKEDQKITTTPKIKPTAIITGVSYIASLSLAGLVIKWFEKFNVPSSGAEWGLYLFLGGIWLLLVSWPLILLRTKWKDFASIIFNESTKDVEHTIIKTPDPTAIEFQRYFSRILKDAQKRPHKFVIVLDNIDRLSDDEAIKMLTTMRSFFCENHNKNVWVLVPFDTASLKRIFSRDGKIIQSADGLLSNQNNDNEMADAFIDKTFSVKFYVAPPLVTDNKDYFIEKFDEAFSDVIEDPDDKEAVFELYERERYPASKNTPRRVKTFINELTSLYRIWHDQIDIKTLALYCLKRPLIEGQDLRYFLTQAPGQSGPISRQQIYLLDNEDWDRDFAAIYYGVEKDKALFVLAGDELHKGLEEGRQDEEFGKLTNLHGFTEILKEQVLTYGISYCSSGTTLAKVSQALAFLQSQTDKDLSFAWKRLADHTKEIERWDAIDEDSQAGIFSLLSNVSKADIKNVCVNIRRTLGKLEGNIINNTSAAQYWASILEEVAHKLTSEGVEKPLQSFSLQSKEDKKEFLLQALLYAAQQGYKRLGSFFSKTFALSENSTHLNELLSDSSDITNLKDVIEYLSNNKTESEFREVVDSLHRILADQNTNNDAATAAQVLNILNTNKFKNTYAKEKSAELCAQGALYGHLLTAKNEEYEEDVAHYLLLAIQHDLPPRSPTFNDNKSFISGYQKRHEILQSSPDKDDVILNTLLSEILKHTQLTTILMKMVKVKEYRNFSAKLLQVAIEKHSYLIRLNTEYFIEQYSSFSYLLGALEAGYEGTVIEKISQKSDFVDALVSEEKIFTGSPYRLYKMIFEQKTENGKEVIKRVQEYFKNMPIEGWKESIKNWIEDEDNKIVCLEFLLDSGEKVTLGAGACDALAENFEELSPFAKDNENSKLLSKFPDMLYARDKKTFVRKLKNKIITLSKAGETEKWDNLIHIFGRTLSETSIFKGDNDFDDVLTSAIREPLIQTLSWLKRDGEEISQCLNKEQLASFKERLLEAIRSTDDNDRKALLVGIATSFKIDLPEDKEEEDEENIKSKTS